MPSNLQVNCKYKHPFIFANVFLRTYFISLALSLYFNCIYNSLLLTLLHYSLWFTTCYFLLGLLGASFSCSPLT
jgi:hypothetical protein